jgi:hypothetical protein
MRHGSQESQGPRWKTEGQLGRAITIVYGRRIGSEARKKAPDEKNYVRRVHILNEMFLGPKTMFDAYKRRRK